MFSDVGKNLLVMGASPGFAFSIGTFLLNLKDASPGTFSDAMIYAEDLSERDMEVINALIPAEFSAFRPQIDPKKLKKSSYLAYFSPYVLSKLECFALAPKYDSVTWIDSDVVVLGNLAKLVEPSPTGALFMSGSSLRAQLLGEIRGYDLDSPAVFTGTFSISSNFPSPQKIYRDALRFVETWPALLHLPEQAALTAAFQENKIQFDPLDVAVFAPHPNSFDETALLLHSYGPKKFWNGLNSEIWNKHYAEWLKLGGTPMSKKASKEKLRKLTTRLWTRVQRFAR